MQVLRDESRALQAQLAASRIGAQFSDARLESHECLPQPWPEDIEPGWKRSFGVLSFWPADRPSDGARERIKLRAESMVEDANESPAPAP